MNRVFEYIERIEEYLKELDSKNTMFLYISVFILAAIVYYNYNIEVLGSEISEKQKEITKLEKKLKQTSRLEVTLRKLKKELKKLQSRQVVLNEDLKYINTLVNSSPVLHIDEVKFLDILKDVLKKATLSNIEADYEIIKTLSDYKKYEIKIQGNFLPVDFENFAIFIKNLEKIKAIKKIDDINFTKNEKEKKINFDMKILFWSLQ